MIKIKNDAISVGIWSEDYKKLAAWYKDILGFTPKLTGDLPNDSFEAFQFGECWFWIGKHDRVHGNSKDPYRVMIEFYVESVMDTFTELQVKAVTIIAEPFQDPIDPNKYCMTVSDPEGNILQFYGKK